MTQHAKCFLECTRVLRRNCSALISNTRAPPSTQPPCAFKKWRFGYLDICCQIISVELPWFNVGFGAQVCDKILFSCQILSVISMFTMFILKFWHFILNENNVEGEIVTATPSMRLFHICFFLSTCRCCCDVVLALTVPWLEFLSTGIFDVIDIFALSII